MGERVDCPFSYNGRTLNLFRSLYNSTRLNERGVELAVAADWLARNPIIDTDWPAGRMLEVGNVLGHYPELDVQRHAIIDRYEKGPGIENVDVFAATGSYHTIMSISTLEHVRWDAPEQHDPDGSWHAIEHLAALLTPQGRMLVTVPTGHHTTLDEQLANRIGSSTILDLGDARCTVEASTLTRYGSPSAPEWVQTDEPWFIPYAVTSPWAEAVWVGEFTRMP